MHCRSHEMQRLFNFWLTFLIDNFNDASELDTRAIQHPFNMTGVCVMGVRSMQPAHCDDQLSDPSWRSVVCTAYTRESINLCHGTVPVLQLQPSALLALQCTRPSSATQRRTPLQDTHLA